MKRDIRDLFNEDFTSRKKLPVAHRKEFIEKLMASNKKSKRNTVRMFFKIAAVVTLFFSLSFFVFNNENSKNVLEKELTMEDQIKNIEKKYLFQIDKEWQSFLVLAKDEKLIKRYNEKLKTLDKDYKTLSSQFYLNTSSIETIESLIENLKTRLNLLKEIQKHIKILNQKNEHNENSI